MIFLCLYFVGCLATLGVILRYGVSGVDDWIAAILVSWIWPALLVLVAPLWLFEAVDDAWNRYQVRKLQRRLHDR